MRQGETARNQRIARASGDARPITPHALTAGVLRARASGGLDQASEVRFEIRPDFGFVFRRQLWPSAVDCGSLHPKGYKNLLAGVLHQQLRQLGLQDTALATAQPKTVILALFKIAVRDKQYKDRLLLHLPSACPVKALLAKVCKRLYPPNSRVRAMLASL